MPLSLFGGLVLSTPGGTPVSLPTRKTALVLATLALTGEKGISREALAEWVWPDRNENQAKSSLRQALTAIRKTLPETLGGHELVADTSMVGLVGPTDLVDVRQFEKSIQSDSIDDLFVAAKAYSGELLDGVQLPQPLEDTIATHRERLHRQALALVERLSEHADRRPDARVVCETLANRLLLADPVAEAAHRAIIRIRLTEGESNAARLQLDRCKQLLAQHLGADPEDKTTALLDAASAVAPIRANETSSAARHAQADVAARPTRPSVVVMPFDNLAPRDDDFLADGIVEEITSALSRIRDFFVIARQSAYAYKGRFVDVREIGKDLGVQYAVEGTVRRGSDRVRITVQLVETRTATQLWSDRYEGDRTELFELQDRIASQVAGAINPSIRASEIERAKSARPEDLKAYDLMLQAFPHFWAHRKEENEKALALYSAALERDPDYGVALAFKAWCHAQQACYLWADEPAVERVKALAMADEAALRVDDHATALTAIGAAYSITTKDQALAASFIDRSLALDPNNAWGWMRAGWLKFYGREDDAMACFERALVLSPFDPFTFNIYFGMAAVHARSGEFDEAVDLVNKGLRAGPGVTWAYRMLANFHARAGNAEESSEALAIFLRHYPGITIKKMREGFPPASVVAEDTDYWDGMRKAGVSES